MIDMGQADRSLRFTPSNDSGVFDRHRERVRTMNRTYKGFFITETAYHWGYEVIAMPDHGETLRLKMIGYTKTERLQAIKNLINERAGQ